MFYYLKRMSILDKIEIYRELMDLVSEMNYDVDAVIVEGPHDKKSLSLLGYVGSIFTCSSGSSLLELADSVANRFTEIVILTDFDKAGNTLFKTLTTLFSSRKVKVNNFYRRRFRKLLKTVNTSTIESIYRLKLEQFRN